MLSLSKALSAGQAFQYHQEQFTNSRSQYYSAGDTIEGQWHGRLAAEWGLRGGVDDDTFHRLALGQDPHTGEQLVRHRHAVHAMDHRAGFDATLAAPKGVSLVALVGEDDRVRVAHRESVAVALTELERYVQARISKSEAQTTGNGVFAVFEHDTSRPVQGVVAPQLHSHAVLFNLTRTETGRIRPLQPRELYRSQQFVTAVYRAELAARLVDLGYEIAKGKHAEPEIKGFTPEYLAASSPRRKQIVDQLESLGLSGAGAAAIAQKQTREKKVVLSPAIVQQQHQDLALAHGDQPAKVVAYALARRHELRPEPGITARAAVAYAKARTFERDAVSDERVLIGAALVRAMGDRRPAEIRAAFEQRFNSGDFVQVPQKPGVPGRAFTTPEMIRLEQANLDRMRQGQGQARPLAAPDIRRDIDDLYPKLSQHQRDAIGQILANRDQAQALQGGAGTGKTTLLAALKDLVEREGYQIRAYAPTSMAALELAKSGIETSTLQKHLASEPEHQPGRWLRVLDESSMTSSVQMQEFLNRHPHDRYLLVGDTAQHQPVDAGIPFQQMQEHGLATTYLTEIERQKHVPELKAVVGQLSRGEIVDAVAALQTQGRIHEVQDRGQRYAAIAAEYLTDPRGTIVVSPKNEHREELNVVLHRAMQQAGTVDPQEHRTRVLVPRNDLTGADRMWAGRYERDDVVRYTKGSQTLGIPAGTYGRVVAVDAKTNEVRVRLDGHGFKTYDPRRLQGVTVYREAERAFAVGDRAQFTAPAMRTHGVANKQRGTITRIDHGTIELAMDNGKKVTVTPGQQHLDHGYAVTSHSSQSLTEDRCLMDVDTTLSAALVNHRMAYVAGSRSRYDLQVFTDSAAKLPQALNREQNQETALQQPKQDLGYSRAI